MRTEHLQLISAAILSLGGLILLFCGVFIDPQGQLTTSISRKNKKNINYQLSTIN